MKCLMLSEIADDVSAARSALSDALHLAAVALMEGAVEGNGWHSLLQTTYGEVAELERMVQDAEQKARAA